MTAAETIDFAMFDLPTLTPAEAAARKATRAAKRDAARLAYLTAEREGAADPREAARAAAAAVDASR